MSLILRAALALVVVLAVLADANAHRHHKKGQVHQAHEVQDARSLEDRYETTFTGTITCSGNGVNWIRPYLHSPWYPRTIINIAPTENGGKYSLNSGTLFDTRGKIEMMIRHTCRVEGLPPMDKCAVPYYTTNIKIDLDPRVTHMEKDYDLFELHEYTTADCLY